MIGNAGATQLCLSSSTILQYCRLPDSVDWMLHAHQRTVQRRSASMDCKRAPCKLSRLHIPAAKVLVLGQIVEFDLDELEAVNESR